MGRAFEIQAQLAKSACDAYVFQLTKLGQMMFTGYGMFRTRPEVRLSDWGYSKTGVCFGSSRESRDGCF